MVVITHKQHTIHHKTHKPTLGLPSDKSRVTQSQHTQSHIIILIILLITF